MNPRTAPEPEQRLEHLVRWKIEKYQAGRAKRDPEGASSDAEWSKVFAQAKDK
jgi:hypothetical protein